MRPCKRKHSENTRNETTDVAESKQIRHDA